MALELSDESDFAILLGPILNNETLFSSNNIIQCTCNEGILLPSQTNSIFFVDAYLTQTSDDIHLLTLHHLTIT